MANGAWQRAGLGTEPPPWEPRFGASPGGAVQSRGHSLGAQGGLWSLPTHPSVRESSSFWAALPTALQTGTCPRTVEVPRFLLLLTLRLSKCTQGETFANTFFFLSSPSLSAFLVGHEVP